MIRLFYREATDSDDNSSSFAFLQIIAFLIVLVVYISSITDINGSGNIVKSKQRVNPSINIQSNITDGITTKSDTTFIYTFKEE